VPRILITLIIDAERADQARAILDTIQPELSFQTESIAPYYKGGMKAQLYKDAAAPDWPGQVLETIRTVQILAYGAYLMDDAEQGVDLVAHERFRFPGLIWAEVQIQRATALI
jgi:hypothetical protein